MGFLIGLIMNFRAGTVLSETWEDGQALKDLNAQLVRLISFSPFLFYLLDFCAGLLIYLFSVIEFIMH